MDERKDALINDARLVRINESVLFPWLAKQEEQLIAALCHKLKEGQVDELKIAQVSAVRDLRMHLEMLARRGEAAFVKLNNIVD